MAANELTIKTPRWARPLLDAKRYKGAKGGRGSGKSHFFAEMAVEEMVMDPCMSIVCIREIQKSLKFSAKKTIEAKIAALGVSDLFDVTQTEIRRVGGSGVMIFEGMQDHTADSIKSLEGFGRAWVEEAQRLSARSLELLRPTIREEGSEIWFSWNPVHKDDPVELFFEEQADIAPDNMALIHVNFDQNPFLPDTLRDEMLRDKRGDPDKFAHVWLGEYWSRSDAQVLSGKWRVSDFEPHESWDGPYHGMDFGFAQDPTTAVRIWIHDKRMYVERESGSVGLELDKTAGFLGMKIPDMDMYKVYADSARPESISYLRRHGLPRIEGVKKWPGSVDDGIAHMLSYDEIIIHPRCEATQDEARKYSYKVDKRTGDVLPVVIDCYNHYIDAIRYALSPLIKSRSAPRVRKL